MPLSWNEIRDRAHKFAREWENESSEDAEAKSFWDEFFNVFGVPRRRVASFEQRVKKLDGKDGFIDLLWKGVMLVEHKSRGRNLSAAHEQAIQYFPGLKDEELPRYILTCDFARFHLHDLDTNEIHEFDLSALPQNIHHFGFLAGYEKRTYKEEDPVNIKAAELMGALHDSLRNAGYEGHQLSVFLVRMLFCLFADDTGIFERGSFHDFLNNSTREDGSDTGSQLTRLYQVLNTPTDKRMKTLDETLAVFPYVNGRLFEEPLALPDFNSSMRAQLLKASALDWGCISPGIFGSLFQAVMNPEERRKLGAHYTSEKNILKVINPLFMDDLRDEFESIRNSKPKLQAFHTKIAALRFLDPACGCGNFLVVAYRELRLLEIEVLKLLIERDQQVSVDLSVLVNVDQFCGIEIEEFPCQIAQVAMWLVDHQMNINISNTFGTYCLRLPLTKSAKIVHTNALRIDWAELGDFHYIFGNPPFVGKSFQSPSQKEDMGVVFSTLKGANVLDFVCAWYIKAAKLIQNTRTVVAFVSTNSISQGEQVSLLWEPLFAKFRVKILFAHRTFKWRNEARGVAAVHVVIIGFANFDKSNKQLFEYDGETDKSHSTSVSNINPFLISGSDLIITKKAAPICDVPIMNYGSMPNDGGHLLLDNAAKSELHTKCPMADKYVFRFVMGEELINAIDRWCLWLVNCKPDELRQMPEVLQRVEQVRHLREQSTRGATQELAKVPTLFGEVRQPASRYLALPRVSSVNRDYIPMTFLEADVIAGDKVYTVEGASMFLFGVLMSAMHMSWVKVVAGRLKSDYSYTNTIAYNNYPFPQSPKPDQRQSVEDAAMEVLNAREQFPESSLADLYDPLAMPPPLVKAHTTLDKAVDKCYRAQPFESESKRIEFLFALYEEYTAPLISRKMKKRTGQ